MYYVYEWFIIETDEVIYVGKGTRKRYKVKKHNNLFNEMIKRYECSSRIIKTFKSEKEAFDYEFIRIAELKSIGQCVCNIREGGYGGSDSWWTEEIRNKYSEFNVMKSEYQRKRMSEKNPMKNKEIALKTNMKKRKPIIVGQYEYDSIKDACEKLNVYPSTLGNWCKKGINPNGEKCRYKNEPQVEFKGIRYNKGGSKAVVFEGKEYECVKDLCKDVGISERTAHSWLQRGFNPNGNPCRYKNDDRVLIFEDRYVKRNKNKAKSVIVNDVEYDNVDDACEKLGLKKSTLYSYLQAKKYNNKYICRYGNQKPSQTKSE